MTRVGWGTINIDDDDDDDDGLVVIVLTNHIQVLCYGTFDIA